MKRIISLIFALLLVSSLGFSAFAKSKTCTIVGEMDSILYDGYMYYPIDDSDFYIESSDWDYWDYEFEDKNFEKRLEYVDISIPNEIDYIIEAVVNYGSSSEYIYYVRSDKQEWIDEFLEGKNASHIITYNNRAYVSRYLDIVKIEDWISEENKVSVTRKQMKFYYKHEVYTTDSTKALRLQVGDVYEDGEEFYFVRYSDYTEADLIGDGNYANLSVAYKLSDEEYIEKLKEEYSEYATETVDEALMEENEIIDNFLVGFTDVSLVVTLLLFFIMIPLAAIIVSLILLFVKNALLMYRGWLMAIVITAAVILLCSVPIIIVLL